MNKNNKHDYRMKILENKQTNKQKWKSSFFLSPLFFKKVYRMFIKLIFFCY